MAVTQVNTDVPQLVVKMMRMLAAATLAGLWQKNREFVEHKAVAALRQAEAVTEQLKRDQDKATGGASPGGDRWRPPATEQHLEMRRLLKSVRVRQYSGSELLKKRREKKMYKRLPFKTMPLSFLQAKVN
jgi:hypothetical protein